MADSSTKMGVTWKHLDTLREWYEEILNHYAEFVMSKTGRHKDTEGNFVTKDDAYNFLRASLSRFYLSVQDLFNKYLEDEKRFGKEFPGAVVSSDEDYLKIIMDDDLKFIKHIDEAIKVISYWSTTYGPFATYVKEIQFDSPEEKFMDMEEL